MLFKALGAIAGGVVGGPIGIAVGYLAGSGLEGCECEDKDKDKDKDVDVKAKRIDLPANKYLWIGKPRGAKFIRINFEAQEEVDVFFFDRENFDRFERKESSHAIMRGRFKSRNNIYELNAPGPWFFVVGNDHNKSVQVRFLLEKIK